MSKPKRNRRRGKPVGTVADHSKGVPAFAPTPERLARGDFKHEDITEHVYARDETGDRREGRRVVMGRVYRDGLADASKRLRRFKGLAEEQITAGGQLEADWEMSGLEPRMTANLQGAGGGGKGRPLVGEGWAAGLGDAVVKARDRLHAAQEALRLGGDEVARVVEAIVLRGESSGAVGATRYADEGRALAHVSACLSSGLNILAGHYKLRPLASAAEHKRNEIA